MVWAVASAARSLSYPYPFQNDGFIVVPFSIYYSSRMSSRTSQKEATLRDYEHRPSPFTRQALAFVEERLTGYTLLERWKVQNQIEITYVGDYL
jgi:hypothetical protein